MSGVLLHTTQTARANNTDYDISRNAWDDDHQFHGGNHGAILVRDTTDATYGGNWVQSVAVGQILISKGAATTPAWSGSVGLNVAAPATAGMLAQTLAANNVTGHVIKRNTDAAPTGNFVDYQNAAAASLWTVDITGSLTAGTIPNARVTPPGSNTYIVYNDSSAWGADANFTWNKTNQALTLTGKNDQTTLTIAAGSITGSGTTKFITKTGTWNTSGNVIGESWAFTETAKGASSRYFQILGGAAGATDEFYVETGGATYCKGTITTGGGAVVANTNVFGSTTVINSSFAINSGGTAAPMSSTLVLGWTASGSINAGTAIDTGLFRNAAGVVEVNNGTTGTYRDLQLRNLLASGKVTNYNNIATAGGGVPAIYSAPAVSATKSANFTVLTFTPAAAAGTFRVSGVITTTSGTNTGTVQFTLDYVDSQGTTHTADIIPLCDATGTIATTKSGASKEFHAIQWLVTINNSATNMVLKVVVTGSVNYTVTGAIEWIG